MFRQLVNAVSRQANAAKLPSDGLRLNASKPESMLDRDDYYRFLCYLRNNSFGQYHTDFNLHIESDKSSACLVGSEMCIRDRGKTNLSHDGLNPAHVPYWRVNNPTLWDFCVSMIGRADIEGSKSNVAMNAWLPQASYPCGNFSDTSSCNFRNPKGSLGHYF